MELILNIIIKILQIENINVLKKINLHYMYKKFEATCKKIKSDVIMPVVKYKTYIRV